MLTMVIAEDDRLERESLMEAGHVWEALGITIADMAENGRQGLELVRRLQPDILLTDIRMPQMNGLELALAIRQDGLDTRIVLVSGYEDFAYAKAGIQAGVSAYLLKPYTIGELFNTLQTAAEECLHEKRRRREEGIREKRLADSLPVMEEKFLETALYGRYRDSAELFSRMDELELDFAGRDFLLMKLTIDHAQSAPDAAQHPVEVLSLMELLEESTAGYAYRKILLGGRNEYLIILSDAIGVLSDKLAIERAAQDICRSICMERDQYATIGVSRPAGLAGLAQAYQEVCEAVEHSFTLGHDRAIFYDDVAACGPKYPNATPYVRTILSALRVGNAAEVEKGLDELFAELQKYPALTIAYAANVCLTAYLQAMLAVMEMGGDGSLAAGDRHLHANELYQCRSLTQMHTLMRSLLDALCNGVTEQAQIRINDAVSRVKQIIAYQYPQDITLDTIAAEVYLSPNYLNTVFKRGTGMSISKWLTDTRIHRAIELLGDPVATVGQIAEDVGYRNAAYFSTVFKKHTGSTPNEYRNRSHPA